MFTPELISIIILLAVPACAAVLLALLKPDIVRNIIAGIASAAVIAVSVFLAVIAWSSNESIVLTGVEWVNPALFILELAIAAIILILALKYKKILAAVLALVQAGLLLFLEFSGLVKELSETTFVLSNLSLIMILIIGIIGTLVCVYALGYMKDYHEHQKDVPERKRFFFAVMFFFISAMFGIVVSGNIMWLLAFWEVTTLSSFLLIGYSKTKEATDNSFRAVWMNLIGGVCFTAAIVFLLTINSELISITKLLAYEDVAALSIPLALIAVAGLTKAAQMPFSTWLTGAMVAPTPVSALLHSSTMVKAGVYLLVLFAPLFSQTWVGVALALVGMFTFVATSALAISQSNAKKVLAYSTIANLGLITACAGIGTPEAVMAAILLIIFHAAAKGLLFLCVGAVEHKIGSRDIEDMDGLLVRQPLLASLMVIGISGMYLAPFGMLISKWAALEAFITAPLGFVFIILLAFGSAFTIFFWTKWLGKLFMRMGRSDSESVKLHISEKLSVVTVGVITLLACVSFPTVIKYAIAPYLAEVFGEATNPAFASIDTLVMCGIMFLVIAALTIAAVTGSRSGRELKPYLNGRATDAEGNFLGSVGVYKQAKTSNYYLEEFCGEKTLLRPSWLISILLIAAMFVFAFMGVVL